MSSSRRLASLLLILLMIGAPAAALSFACVGDACDETAVAAPDVPFCTLPKEMRGLLEAGYYEGRSPEVFAVAKDERAVGYGDGMKAAGAGPIWPNPASGAGIEVPIFLWGEGVVPGPMEGLVGLDQVAPTLAAIAGLERGNDDVRSGAPIEGTWERAEPSLLVLIAQKGMSGPTSAKLRRGAGGGGAFGTATASALPIDTAATLTTVGTGGLPSQHGITGSLLRNDEGKLVEAWSERSPGSVIASLADDLERNSGGKALVGMVATDPTDRGLIGRDWYLSGDRAEFEVVNQSQVVSAVQDMARRGYGDDDVTDLLAVSIEARNQRQLAELMFEIRSGIWRLAGPPSVTLSGNESITYALFGTGAASAPELRMTGKQVVADVEQTLAAPVVETAIPGALFLDKQQMAAEKLTTGKVMDALEAVTVPGTEERVMLDAYPAFSVSFGRYCQP